MTRTAVEPSVATDPPRVKPLKKRKFNRSEALAGYAFIAPWAIGFLVFTLGAMIYSLVISFTHYNLATGSAPPAGLDNYKQLWDDPSIRKSLSWLDAHDGLPTTLLALPRAA